MLVRNRSAATHAPPSDAIRLTTTIAAAIEAALRIPTRLARTVAVRAGGAATPTPAATGEGRGSVGGTLEFGIGNLEFGIAAVESGIAALESGRTFQIPNSEFRIALFL